MPENPRIASFENAVHEGMRSSLVGIGTSLVLAAFKCVAGYVGHSFALVADGVESVSDVYVNLHVIVDHKLSVSQRHGIAHEVEDTVLRDAQRVAEVLVHIEPDAKDHLAKLPGTWFSPSRRSI